MCGGTQVRIRANAVVAGLSPRVRGNRANSIVHRAERRSIPACAGEPQTGQERAARLEVYPRVCGGTRRGPARVQDVLGLSPRVRGNLRRRTKRTPDAGSIPACAGEPACCRAAGSAGWVYPRVCGGTAASFLRFPVATGLSPRVRGNLHSGPPCPCPCGSIPACAGEPRGAQRDGGQQRVYPRVCGGTVARRGATGRLQGLSPRVRGNPAGKTRRTACDRSIPACAGEPVSTLATFIFGAVYPRVCGGTRCWRGNHFYLQGLSPRVRGNPGASMPYSRTVRSIPACAGEPRCSAKR